ncbi:MAG: 30S ribosomal protein S1 [Thermoguttaceae bacterium]
MADVSMEEMLAGGEAVTAQVVLEPETRQSGRVVTITREDVFVELGGREQGIIPLRLFTAEPPQPGAELDVIVVRYNPEDGLYELTLPNVAASVGDWSQISEGMLVEARVTGHNAGGLECEVNRIRGFIPISQIALYRVENLEEFLEQRFLCLVSEADPQRRNLILSRRAVLEREKEEARQKMFESLAPGQIYEGLVRKIMDFGAFVELDGGVDGLLHISQLGWGRVKHPSDVVQEGQRIRVRVDRVDAETGRIGLSYRDLLENPWDTADRKYLPNTPYHGRVMKIMEFGAFVELEPGVEGLVHISELSHKRVARVSDVVKEGEEIDVMVLSVDMDAKRISLSMKAVQPLPEPEMKAEAAPAAKPAEPPLPPPKPKKPAGPLKGGLGRSPEAERFGLKW